MIKEINFSQLYPISAEIKGDRITVYLHKFIAGELSLSQLKSIVKRELTNSISKFDVVSREGQLILALETSSSSEIDESRLTDIVSDFISRLLPSTLRNQITGNKLVYITKTSGIPLMGRIDFGIIDRGTNLIQIRPITGCVLNCPFCSVDSGSKSKTRITDFIVDPDYMVEEVKELCEFKGSESIELHIDGQGEPTLYPYLSKLVKQFSLIPGVETISLQTNGVPLTEKLVNQLKEAGLSRINLSINTLDSDKAIELSGYAGYNLDHILRNVEYIKSSGISLLVAPLWIPRFNDEEILKIIRFVKKIGASSSWPVLGIQNYIVHRHGRKIKGFKPYPMRSFQQKLEELEEKQDIRPLVLRRSDFGIRPMKSYPKPFKRGEIAEVEILERGRMIGEMVGVGRGRALHVLTSEAVIHSRKRIRIVRTKHNIFIGKTID